MNHFADPDFNNDGLVNGIDLDDLYAVFSEGQSSTGDNDSIDINRDGAFFDPADLEAYEKRIRFGLPADMPWAPKQDDNGATIIPPAERTIYVSNDGDDANAGLQQDAPIRTVARAYALARNGRADHIAFKRGGVWDERIVGEYGVWDKGGATSTRPMVLKAYGEGPRPKFVRPDKDGTMRVQGDGFAGNLWVIGLDFTPNPLNYGGKPHCGIIVYASTIGVVVEGCNFEGGNSAFIFDGVVDGGLMNVVFRRNTVHNTFSMNGSHGGGGYVVRVEGMLFEENDLSNLGLTPSGGRDENSKFSQGVYIVATPGTFGQLPFVARYNVIRNVAHAGLQMRAGRTYAVQNEVIDCPIGISGGHAMQPPGVLWRGAIAHNTFNGWASVPGAAQGEHIRVSRGDGAFVFGNIHRNPKVAIHIEQPRGSIVITGNTTATEN
jgi:hypothetical protein